MRPQILYPYFTHIQYLKGIGPILSKKIAKLVGGERVFDLLCHKPSAIIDRTHTPKMSDAIPDSIATFRVQVDEIEYPKRHGLPAKVKCSNSSGYLDLIYFHFKKEILESQFTVGEQRIISGKVERQLDRLQIIHPDKVARLENAKRILRVEPIYPLTAGVTESKLQQSIEQCLANVPELPEWQQEAEITFKTAFINLHNPQKPEDLGSENPARKRLAYDELLAIQLAHRLVYKRISIKTPVNIPLSNIANPLPFILTNDQKKALDEILADMSSGNRMFRLVQGDVGSGKTAVATLAMLHAGRAGYQSCFMMPTTLLAQQQQKFVNGIAEKLGLRAELLTGNEKGKKREQILQDLHEGEIHILIGTHALIQDWVEFKNLGLFVIDEQHRFGVLQRLKLSEKNPQAHILLMTATPIPRSLSIAAYGDMEISRIVEKPAERKPIETFVMPISKIHEIIESIKRALKNGEKIYWICPLVAESEKSDLAAAEERFRFFEKTFGSKVGLIHGKMKEAEKSAVLQKFLNGEIRLLVATTVVEVGIDVRDATIMFIEHSERFGLSQLHQLRGRVGRGDKESKCILLYAGNLGQASIERLKVMKNTNDGFKIAEEDLRIRGSGDMLGTKQSGFIEFKFAFMPDHENLLEKAREDARGIMKTDPGFATPRGQNLRLLLSLFEYDETIDYVNAG